MKIKNNKIKYELLMKNQINCIKYFKKALSEENPRKGEKYLM